MPTPPRPLTNCTAVTTPTMGAMPMPMAMAMVMATATATEEEDGKGGAEGTQAGDVVAG
jgi:hypothetical protein